MDTNFLPDIIVSIPLVGPISTTTWLVDVPAWEATTTCTPPAFSIDALAAFRTVVVVGLLVAAPTVSGAPAARIVAPRARVVN